MDRDDFLPRLNKTAESHLRKVQQKIEYCIYCQPYEGGNYVWVLGEKVDLDDLFEDLNVPERYRSDIAQHLYCPNCGNSGFERYEEVGIEDRYNRKIKESIKKAEKEYGRQIDEFQKHLEVYPTLALTQSLGKKIYNEIMERNTAKCQISGDFWRARLVSGSTVFDCDDLYAPAIGVANEGRYHHAGQRVLYVADSEETAIKEILDDNNERSLVWIQEYKIGEIDDILDLRGEWDNLGECSSAVLVAILSKRILEKKLDNRNSTWRPQYFITRFIADCARAANYKGIKYTSTKGFGENIVFFEPDKLAKEEKGRPRVFIYEKKAREFPAF